MPMSPSPMMYQQHAGGARQMYHGLVDSINDFAEHTSAHGIPRAFSSKTCLKKCLWLLLFFVCLTAFIVQAYQIVMRFFRNDIIVGVELKFENIPFPSVTVCNNNPYKNSLARTMGSVRDTLLAFDDAIGRSNTASSSTQLNQEPEDFDKRRKRQVQHRIYEKIYSDYEGLLAVYSFCACPSDPKRDCTALKKINMWIDPVRAYTTKSIKIYPCSILYPFITHGTLQMTI